MKRPKPGDAVIVAWIDSGLYEHNTPSAVKPLLHVSEVHGRVLMLKASEELANKYGARKASKILVVASDSAGPGDDSHIHHVWWPSVVSCKIVRG